MCSSNVDLHIVYDRSTGICQPSELRAGIRVERFVPIWYQFGWHRIGSTGFSIGEAHTQAKEKRSKTENGMHLEVNSVH